MYAYEVRICRPSHVALPGQGPAALIWVAPHPSTYVAFCQARAHAALGEIVEVWRDHQCVHREVMG
jgi:hypothetical protein